MSAFRIVVFVVCLRIRKIFHIVVVVLFSVQQNL